MTTRSQFHSYCVEQLHMLDKPAITQGTHMLNWTLIGDLVLVVIVGIAAYEIGKRGLVATYTWLRNKFAKSPVVTQPTTVAA